MARREQDGDDMLYLWAALLVIANAAALVMTLFMLPGNWVMVALTLLVAWWRWDDGMFSVPVLVAIVVLAAAGEVVEFFSSAAGARRAGGSRLAGLFAIVGAIVGTFVIPVPVIGTLVGLAVGAFAGASGTELVCGRDVEGAVRSGLGAGAGRLAGTGLKCLIGVVIWIIVAVAAFWP